VHKTRAARIGILARWRHKRIGDALYRSVGVDISIDALAAAINQTERDVNGVFARTVSRRVVINIYGKCINRPAAAEERRAAGDIELISALNGDSLRITQRIHSLCVCSLAGVVLAFGNMRTVLTARGIGMGHQYPASVQNGLSSVMSASADKQRLRANAEDLKIMAPRHGVVLESASAKISSGAAARGNIRRTPAIASMPLLAHIIEI